MVGNVNAFYIVQTDGPPESYAKHWATLEQALEDFLRLVNEGEAEDIALRFSA
jgi:hypothetical protein